MQKQNNFLKRLFKLLFYLLLSLPLLFILLIPISFSLGRVLLFLDSEDGYRGGKSFVKVCHELNGKEFTYENISKLNGNIFVKTGENSGGLVKLEENHINDFFSELSGNKTYNNITNGYTKLQVYKGEFFKPIYSYAWVCDLNLKDNKIFATSRFYLTD